MEQAGTGTELSPSWSALGRRHPLELEAARLWRIEIPFLRPVPTARGVHRTRPLVLVQLSGRVDGGPVEGWGECAALADDFYDPEDADGAFVTLGTDLAPGLLDRSDRAGGLLPAPADLDPSGSARRHSPLSFAALEMAVADAHLRAESRSWSSLLGVTGTTFVPGAVVGICPTVDDLVDRVSRLVDDGYRRVKLKIGPGWDVEPVRAVRASAPDLLLQVDANGSYGEEDTDHLSALDEFGLLCIEQPFGREDLSGHARLAERLSTPVCLDESIDSSDRVTEALAMGACSVICLKPSRVGGLGSALELIDRCAGLGVPVWMGGMFESGYARGVNAVLAALPGSAWPGDLSPARTYLEDDLVTDPPVFRDNGSGALTMGLPEGSGMGPAPERDALERLGVRTVVVHGSRP